MAIALGAASDERLAELVADGHERAFTTIYSRYHQRLYRYCLAMLRNEADAHDALQSAFTAAFTALSEAKRSAPLRPWLFRIVHNEAISLLRRRRPEAPLSELSEIADIGVEEHADRRAELQLLLCDLRELPDRQRAALVMRELSGLSHEEIALALDVSAAAAKQTIFEARKSLMEFAAGREIDCEEIRRTISDGDGRAIRARRVRGHLSGCAGCDAFAAQMRRRRTALRAIAPPLPALAAQQLLGRVLHSGGTHGGGAQLGVGAGAGAVGKLSAVALSTKAIAGVAVIVTAGAGVGVLHHVLHADRAPAHVRVAPPLPRGRDAGAVVAARHSVGRVITLSRPGAPAVGGGTAGEVHRLRHGFWAFGRPSHGPAGAVGHGAAQAGRHGAAGNGPSRSGAGTHGNSRGPAVGRGGGTTTSRHGTGTKRSSGAGSIGVAHGGNGTAGTGVVGTRGAQRTGTGGAPGTGGSAKSGWKPPVTRLLQPVGGGGSSYAPVAKGRPASPIVP